MKLGALAPAIMALVLISVDAPTAPAVAGNDATALQTAPKQQPTQALRTQVAALRTRQATIRSAAQTLQQLSQAPMPAGLPAGDRKIWPQFISFLQASQARIFKVAGGWSTKLAAFDRQLDQIDASGDKKQLAVAAKQLQQMELSFSLRYLSLQQKMQHENRQFNMVSNVMKTKHDTAKATINNIR